MIFCIVGSVFALIGAGVVAAIPTDIIKVEGNVLDKIDLDILGYIDHSITVNIIKDQVIVEKRALKLPSEIRNVLRCRNPRCITSIEQELPHIFYLADEKKEIYRCRYCDEKYSKIQRVNVV